MTTISELAVEHFQSLWSVKVELGKLTVVVGHSNSGKSAFGRALKAVSRNSVVPGHVSKGATTARLRLAYSDGSAVELERGKGASTYRLIDEHGHEELYAKCGTTVPVDVQKVLRTPEGDPDLFFQTQFDAPWLLSETGSQAAKVLGELTNVSMLAEAAREANRRRQDVLKVAGIRRKDAEAAVVRVQTEYADLGARKQAVEEAREMLAQVIDEGARADQLQYEAERYKAAVATAQKASSQAEELTSLLKSVAGDMADLFEIEAKINAVESLSREALAQQEKQRVNESDAQVLQQQIEEAEREIHETLKEVGVCPLCQQTIQS